MDLSLYLTISTFAIIISFTLGVFFATENFNKSIKIKDVQPDPVKEDKAPTAEESSRNWSWFSLAHADYENSPFVNKAYKPTEPGLIVIQKLINSLKFTIDSAKIVHLPDAEGGAYVIVFNLFTLYKGTDTIYSPHDNHQLGYEHRYDTQFAIFKTLRPRHDDGKFVYLGVHVVDFISHVIQSRIFSKNPDPMANSHSFIVPDCTGSSSKNGVENTKLFSENAKYATKFKSYEDAQDKLDEIKMEYFRGGVLCKE